MAEVIRIYGGAKTAGSGQDEPVVAPVTPSDAALVVLAQADRGACAALYSRYLDPIHRYCYRRLGSQEAAEDATSLVFTKALAALPGYRAGSFRSWLFAIAHNVITDQLRRLLQPPSPTPLTAWWCPDCRIRVGAMMVESH